jgi:hypothetical protein
MSADAVEAVAVELPAELAGVLTEAGWSPDTVALAVRHFGVAHLCELFCEPDPDPRRDRGSARLELTADAGPSTTAADPSEGDPDHDHPPAVDVAQHFAIVPVRNGAGPSPGRLRYVLDRFRAELAGIGYTIAAVPAPSVPEPEEEP